jgi:hypothetical protein
MIGLTPLLQPLVVNDQAGARNITRAATAYYTTLARIKLLRHYLVELLRVRDRFFGDQAAFLTY